MFFLLSANVAFMAQLGFQYMYRTFQLGARPFLDGGFSVLPLVGHLLKMYISHFGVRGGGWLFLNMTNNQNAFISNSQSAR
jgi:hypothetical protein